MTSDDKRETSDERFLIPSEQLPPALDAAIAEGDAHAAPAPARPAATIALIRDGDRGPEVLLLRRPGRGFAADAWVFPGGARDPDDRRSPPVRPTDPHQWAERLRIDDPMEAWGFVIAAIREAWEETGIWVGDHTAREDEVAAVRHQVLAGACSYSAAAQAVGFVPGTDAVVYLARWITPVAEPRRYDTRFFMAPVSPGAHASLVGAEIVDMVWLTPDAAIAGYEENRLVMLPPTIHTLRRLDGFTSVDAMTTRLRREDPPSFLPRLRPHPLGAVIEVEEVP